MLGAGGAARSVAFALAKAGAKQVLVCARNKEKTADLCAMNGNVLVPTGFDGDSLAKAAQSAQVLVNCTSLGMEGQGQFQDFSFLDALPSDAVVCDLIYHPAETELLRLARENGHRTMNGLPLLVWQGVLALEKFLGRDGLDRDAMAKAAYGALDD
jgi:shikimate 5-dehydrogenase